MRALRPSLLALGVALVAACGDDGGAGAGGSQPDAPSLFGPEIETIQLEVDYAADAEPYTGSVGAFGDLWSLFQDNAEALFAGRQKTIVVPSSLEAMEALGDVGPGPFDSDAILAIARDHRDARSEGTVATFYVVWLNGYYAEDGAERPEVLGVNLGDTGVIGGIAAALLERGANASRPVLALSDNSIAHALVALGAMHAGAPIAPVSPAYSPLSSTHGRLRYVAGVVGAAVVFAEDRGRYAKALDALEVAPSAALDAEDVRRLSGGSPAPRAASGPDTVAKILFSSGSTGEPKGIVNTHRMLTSNQESLRACWPFLASISYWAVWGRGSRIPRYDGTEGELYDTRSDPHAFENRWDDPAMRSLRDDLVADLRDHLPPERADPLLFAAPT